MAFDLCYKCYLSQEIIHPSAHPFIPIGPEYPTESEVSESESEEDDDNEEEEEEEGEDDDEEQE